MRLLDIATEFADLNIFNEFTRSALLGRVKVFCDRTGVRHIADIDMSVVVKFKNLTLENSAPVTYNGYVRYFRVLFDYAIERKLIDRNLFREIRTAPEGVPPPKTMDHRTIRALCDHISNNSDSFFPDFFWLAVVSCLFYTGMRRRQLISLRVGDVRFEDKAILLSYEGSKTKRSWTIPLHDELADRLQDLMIRSQTVLGRKLQARDFVFVASRFNPRYVVTKQGCMRGDSITGFFKRLSKSMGEPVGAHRFRHTFASDLCNPEDDSPPDIFAVQAMLGHTNVQTTRGYVRTSISRMESTLKKMPSPF